MVRRNELCYGLGTLVLGIVGVCVGDFALQWQPVPADIPLRTPLAYLSAVILLAVGAILLIGARPRPILLLASAFYGLWVLLLHLPIVVTNASKLGEWNGLAEILAITMGGVTGWALTDPNPESENRIVRIAAWLLRAALHKKEVTGDY